MATSSNDPQQSLTTQDMERMGQFIPPLPEEIRRAESQILEMFRAGNRGKKQNG